MGKVFAKYKYRPPTPMEARILELRLQGLSTREIAPIIGYSMRNTSHYLWPLYKHWGVNNVGDAVRIALEENYLVIERKDWC